MLEKQYFAHISPTGQQASDLAREFGYAYKIIAENIGSGHFYTNQKIVDGWMQSPGHRENILSSDVRDMGAAVIRGNMKGKETYVAVQIFGLQSPPVAHNNCVAPSENLSRDIEMKKAEITSLQDQLVRLKNELDTDQESIERDKKYTFEDTQRIQKINEKIHVSMRRVSGITVSWPRQKPRRQSWNPWSMNITESCRITTNAATLIDSINI